MVGAVRFDVQTLLYAAMSVLLGFQSVVFAFFTKIFAISEGLMPEDRNLNRLFRYITLESGLAAGFALIVIGLTASFLALGSWGATHFGLLDPGRSLRLVIPAVLSLTLGFELVLSSFFFSVLGMKRKDRMVPGAEPQSNIPTAAKESGEGSSSQTELA
jgi:hypothetical protein